MIRWMTNRDAEMDEQTVERERRSTSEFESNGYWRRSRYRRRTSDEGDSPSAMHNAECQLLKKLLDCLDRLFDGETSVVDVHDLICATRAALAETNHATILDVAERQFLAITRSRKSCGQQRDVALVVTDDLRKHLASVLPFPESSESPAH